MSRLTALCVALLCAMAVPFAAWAWQSDATLARQLAPAAKAAMLEVSSPAFAAGQPMPAAYSQEGDGMSPALEWKNAPGGTRSFAVLLEDPDAKEPKPYVHWTLYNLPADMTRINESMPALPQVPMLGKARQGRTSRGTVGYVGPRPPRGDPPHHYHFQVFALDIMLAAPPGADRQALLAAMQGHVLASGELVGTFQRP